MKATRRLGQTVYISVGGGLYWAASLLYLSAWSPQIGTSPAHELLPPAFSWFAIAAVIGITLAFHKQLMKPRCQWALAAVGLAASVLYAILFAFPASGIVGQIAALLTNACHHAFIIMFWGLAFTSLSKHDAEKAVVLSVLIALAVYYFGLLLPIGPWGAPVAALLRYGGTIPFLLGIAHIPTLERAADPDSLRMLVPFYLNRAFLGLCMAVLFYLASLVRPLGFPAPSPALCLAGCAAAGATLAALAAKARSGSSALRVAPLILLGTLVFPYALPLENLSHAFPLLAGCIAWISWIALSATQLSDIKEHIGLDEAFLAISEKAVVLMSVFLGFALCSLGTQPIGTETLQDFAIPLSAVFVYVSMLVCCYLFSTLIDKKQRQRIVRKAIMRSDEQLRLAYSAIAKKHGLTEREQDVFALMAAGHARPYIREKLCISDGTVKTHSYHIYEKLGIHSREELYKLVDRERSELEMANSDKP
ncbi:response regulator transcription factor [Raoultibacter timonensis]|uniref:HTH luxR-type domain-containing protein n=1 Tax=Raoultibacter timonensis TaxID=1907662 RepID=A0ABN6MG51_9ACTN|nr:helix-turn-helix transcriptional regulator [Raoultibacter timonensis]BDE95772.1 hypothetical protein CE91St30_11050 [Raoultibacter timonensis]BDF50376.1 hypothetical protein CE91St31_11060 [Raoultibacter timonensis]